MNTKFEHAIKQILPPIVLNVARHLLRKVKGKPPELEYLPQGWSTKDPFAGWNDQRQEERIKKRWPNLLRNLGGTIPLTLGHTMNYGLHNTLMCYAYVLMLAARKKDSLTVLDWGSGVGHYYLVSRALLPDVHFEYHCYDVPYICQLGRKLLPEVNFHENAEDVFQRQYDLVFASGSLQCFEDWSDIVHKLAKVSRDFLYISRLSILHRVSSFVVVHRPYLDGYYRERLWWYLNRKEFLNRVEETGLELVREFLIQERPFVHGAPEQGEWRGFLFRKKSNLT